MTQDPWRSRAATTFDCEKRPATGTRGMVVTNHPLASAAGAEMLAAGGNAVDAAVAALFALTVVEPMMVGILGGGLTHLRLPDGSHRIIDGLPTAPVATRPDIFRPVSDTLPTYLDTEGRENAVGPKASAAPGALPAWCETLARFGTMPLADVMEPAIRHAARGFRITPFLHECIADTAADLAKDAEIARLYLPGGGPLAAGARQRDQPASRPVVPRGDRKHILIRRVAAVHDDDLVLGEERAVDHGPDVRQGLRPPFDRAP